MRVPSGAKSVLAVAALAAACRLAGQEGVAPPLPRLEVEGTLPVILNLRPVRLRTDEARLPGAGPRRPSRVAPSAKAYGHADYSHLPPNLSFYAGLSERRDVNRPEVRVGLKGEAVGGRALLIAMETARGEARVSPVCARRLGLEATEGAAVAVPPLRLGSLTLTGLSARVASAGEIPGEVFDLSLPLAAFRGYALFWRPRGGRLGFYPAATPPEQALGAAALKAPCLWHDGALHLQVLIHGRVLAWMRVDGGTPHTRFDPVLLRKSGLDYVSADVAQAALPGRGYVEEADFFLGPASVRLQGARVAPLDGGGPTPLAGVLGRDVLEEFEFFLEVGAPSLWFCGDRTTRR